MEKLLNINFSQDLEYILIFSLILILPKLLLRFRIPSGVTALFLGVVFSQIDSSLINNQLFNFLSMIGITSLFLFAGLEVDAKELTERKKYLSKYLIKFSAVIIIIAFIFHYGFDYRFKISFLVALGIFTPSAGFILNSLHSYDIDQSDESWIKSKAISKEIVSIVILFLVLQGDKPILFAAMLVFFLVCYFLLPPVIAAFFRFIQPYAPNTEIGFLVTLSLVLGVLTKELGTYYIIGAFLVGIIGNRFLVKISHLNEQDILSSLSSFFSIFLPFYFFFVGLNIDPSMISEKTMMWSFFAFFFFTPLRMFLVHLGFLKFGNKQKPKNYYDIYYH